MVDPVGILIVPKAQSIQECIQWTSFFGQMQIQTIDYGLNDTIRTKKKEVI